jgi:MHS family shikimate/dehydroshikimate transporter-like MFS transporter
MARIRVEDTGQRSHIRQVAFASFIGTAIEWYDFFLYGTTAALVFPKLFFPAFSPPAATLASFATFGVAFFARPIGGVVFGHFGDRIGRKSMLVITLLLMGGATFLIGLVPTFEQVGSLAPVLLVVLRFLQGFALGGEWGGATLMVVEHAPEKSRNFYASWPQTGAPVGSILSTAVFAVFSSLPDDQFFSWGWRVPFLLSIILIAVGFFIRLRVLESPVFLRTKELGFESKTPLIEVLRDYHVAAALAVGATLIVINGFYIVTTFTLAYGTGQLGVSRSVLLAGVMLGGVAEVVGIVVFARVADRLGKRPVAIWSAACIFLLSYPFFWLVDTGVAVLICLAMSVWLFVCGALYGILGVFIAELFPVQLRYSGISFGYQVASMLGGSLTPIVAIALVRWADGASWSVATYMAVNALISFVSVYLASERYRVSIHDQRSAERLLTSNWG